jgi:hypothetical protein
MSQVGGVLQAITMPLVSITSAVSGKDPKKQEGGGGVSFDGLLSFMATIAFMLLAGYLCWTCNIKTDMPLRIIFTILAVIFNGFYLIYYFIYRYLMGNKCPV